jgi:hypothetical protein
MRSGTTHTTHHDYVSSVAVLLLVLDSSSVHSICLSLLFSIADVLLRLLVLS